MTAATDWREYVLGDLFDFSNGINADKSAYGRGTPFINVLEVITNESLAEDDIPGLVSLHPKVLARYRVNRGDVLLNRTSETPEEVGLTSVYLGYRPVVFGGFVFRGRPKTLELDINYAKFALRAADVRHQIIARGQGGIRANVGQRDLKSVVVHLPEQPEQRAIAEALDDASALAAALEKAIAKKRAIKQGMLQELLTGRTRLPGFDGSWQTVTFGDIASTSKDRVDAKNATGRVVELEHLSAGTGVLLGDADVSDSVSLKTRFVKGDVLFGKLRAYLRKYWLADRDGFASTEIWALRPRHGVASGLLLRYVVEQDSFIESASTAYGTHMPRSDWKVVSRYELSLPPVDEQEAIGRVLQDADTEIEALERRLEATRAIKQGMMQELLTGRTRLAGEGAA